jgi:23S rRNA (guanosine2251-2'-O)-methyltransferase
MDVIYGIRAVEEALKARGRAFEFVAFARDRQDGRIQKLINLCRSLGVPSRFESREQLTRLASGGAHQGVVAATAHKTYDDLARILENRRGSRAFIVVLDGIEDPHNLGAVIRTADAVGADGIVIPERRAVGVNATVVKVSAGASEHVPVAKVTNIARTLDELKGKNVWTVGVDERGDKPYDQIDYTTDVALVLGAEGKGLHDLVKKKCDFLVRIPMLGKVASLNVSVAGAVVMYEVARQRRIREQG